MMIHAANHSVTVTEDFAAIVPHLGAELTEQGMLEILKQLNHHNKFNYPILLYPHSHYVIQVSAMKQLIDFNNEKFQIAIVSGSEKTRKLYSFFQEICENINILKDMNEASEWLQTQNTTKNLAH